jgi:hypothetical protein
VTASLALGATGCGDAPTTSDCCTVWLINVLSDVHTGVEIRLDGESLYRQPAATELNHQVEAYHSVITGPHTVEFQVLAEESAPARFNGRVLWQLRPGGSYSVKMFDEQVLSVGERYAVTVEQ